jgi:hypothetical protein
MTKLNRWQESEKNPYKSLVDTTFGHPSAKYLRLEGQKQVGDRTMAITLFLLPDTSSKFGNTSPYVDLIAPYVRETLEWPVIEEDGTAHGNPR